MADEYKAPKATVEQDAAADAPSQTQPVQSTPAQEPFSPAKAAGRLGAWFKRTFPGHENAVIFGLIGLIAAVLLFVVGVWRTLIIVLFVVVGVAIGQVVDGDPKILRAVRHLISDQRP